MGKAISQLNRKIKKKGKKRRGGGKQMRGGGKLKPVLGCPDTQLVSRLIE